LQKAGIEKGKYAEDMFSRLYDSIFSELIDVEAQYEKYYKIEYLNFEEFLYKKYSVEPDIICEFMRLKSENENYRIYKKNDFSYGDYGIFHFAFSDEMNERVANILLMK
ncbi:MAG: hypothetical protein Q8M92_03940, partial [Candidatus Subteraquimicrobiales bacterium]|nr:hypothetical protein [Candidatus Subteraquimicrobiales bacterium]